MVDSGRLGSGRLQIQFATRRREVDLLEVDEVDRRSIGSPADHSLAGLRPASRKR